VKEHWVGGVCRCFYDMLRPVDRNGVQRYWSIPFGLVPYIVNGREVLQALNLPSRSQLMGLSIQYLTDTLPFLNLNRFPLFLI
jgi:hypothetical protein